MTDMMSTIPCLFCDWAVKYDPIVPGARDIAMRDGFRHYSTHGTSEETK